MQPLRKWTKEKRPALKSKSGSGTSRVVCGTPRSVAWCGAVENLPCTDACRTASPTCGFVNLIRVGAVPTPQVSHCRVNVDPPPLVPGAAQHRERCPLADSAGVGNESDQHVCVLAHHGVCGY